MNEVMVMKAYMVNRLAVMLMQQHEGMSMQEALSMVFQSDTYQKMMDDKTRLTIKARCMYSPFLNRN